MRISLVGCWHDDNRGDSAILNGLIKDLYEINPTLQLRAISIFSDEYGPFLTSFRHTKSLFPQLDVYVSPISDPYNPNISNLRRLFRAKSIIINNLFSTIKLNRKNILPIVSADLIISVGGYRLKTYRGDLIDLVRILFHSFPMFLAQRYNKIYVIDSQSVGPIRGAIHRRIVHRALRGAKIIGVREFMSFEEVKSLGLVSNLVFTPDSAFSIHPLVSNRVLYFMKNKKLNGGDYIVLAPRQWFFENHQKYHQYVDILSNFVDYLAKNGYRVVLVAHSIGPIVIEDDRKACLDIATRVRYGSPVMVFEDWNAMELAAFYGYAIGVVSVRLHAALLASLSGIPSVAIAYEGTKTQGIMEIIGLGEFVIDISRLSYENLVNTFDNLLSKTDSIRSKLIDNVLLMRKLRREFLRDIVQ